MSVGFTEEQEELRQLVRRFLEQKSSSEQVRALMESDRSRDEAVWTQMAGQLGLQGLVVPEEFGGAGFGPVELGIVFEEMGRALLVAPFFSTVALGAQTLTTSGDRVAMERWLPGIAEGSLTATLALSEASGAWDLDDVATTAEQDGDIWHLSGTKSFVIDGHTADLLLVVARDGDGRIGVFGVEADAAGLTRTKTESLDPTRDLADVNLERTPSVRVGAERDAVEWLGEVTDLVLAALACEQIGGAARCLEMSVEYAKVREQFGRPIGSFQAIKHKCAMMLLEVESGRSAAYHATASVASADSEASVAAVLAKAYCSTAYTHAAKETIQIHGGIGFTWEHDAHLFLRRAKSSELLFGAPATLRARLGDLVGL